MITIDNLSFLEESRIFITGGTGSLGKKLTDTILDGTERTKVVIYSRDEFKQFEMQQRIAPEHRDRMRFFLGDVRDAERLRRGMERVDYVIHAAALKQVPAAEYNPFEFIKTNVMGAENVINAAIDNDVKHVVALSTDKAANPINLYGASKLCSDKLFVSGNSYSGSHATGFSVVRYGNVVGSRGSVIPFFLGMRGKGRLPITDSRMTRFWITLEQGAALVFNAMKYSYRGAIWIPRIPSMKVTDLARVVDPEAQLEEIGIRPGEKLHEVMVPLDDGRDTVQYENHFIIKPRFDWENSWMDDLDGEPCPDGFYYGSDNNTIWVTDDELAMMIAGLDLPEAKIWAAEHGLV